MRDTRNSEAKAARLERSKWAQKAIAKWDGKVDLAPWTSPARNGPRRKGSRLTSPSTRHATPKDAWVYPLVPDAFGLSRERVVPCS